MMPGGRGAAPVVLVVPPVLYPSVPTLGANLLAAECAASGVPARVHHSSVDYAARIGFDLCMRLAGGPPRKMLGEGIFLSAAFPERAHQQFHVLRALDRIEEPMQQYGRAPDVTLEELESCAAYAPAFVAQSVEALLAHSPRIVGVSSMCQQLLASIAFAREVKRQAPEVVTVLGGASATEPMATALLALTDVFDFVFSGEADEAFPTFCRRYLETGRLPEHRVIDCAPVADLDGLPLPDYDDYFEAIAEYKSEPPMSAVPLWLIFESSRGCWWGEKRACTFCGFNAPGGKYRVKSAGRIIQEMDALASRYGIRALYASDNVMAPDFPRVVLPRLIERDSSFTLFYEVKSGLRESDLDTLTEAGVKEIQPGIESLCTAVLGLMSKGVTALDSIRLLRDCRSRQLEVVWNYLTGVPGERREHYEPMLGLVPLVEHLRPPTRWGPLRISRFSPYHRDPDRYGISNIRPWEALQYLFGDAAGGLSQHFTGEYETQFLNDSELMARFYGALWNWAAAWHSSAPPALHGERQEDGSMLVCDSRSNAKQPVFLLRPEMTAALDAVSQPVPGARLPASHRRLVEGMVGDGLVIHYEGQYLSVVTEPAIGKRLRERRQPQEQTT